MARIYSTIIIFMVLLVFMGQHSVVHAQEAYSAPTKPVVSKRTLAKQQKYFAGKLDEANIQVIRYGVLNTIILPTDSFFARDTGQINKDEYLNLYYIAQYIKTYRPAAIHVGSFTDEVGTEKYKLQLSQYRAQEMSIYLTINGIPQQLIQARGYADQYDIAENSTVYGSAMNRRIVIQWSL